MAEKCFFQKKYFLCPEHFYFSKTFTQSVDSPRTTKKYHSGTHHRFCYSVGGAFYCSHDRLTIQRAAQSFHQRSCSDHECAFLSRAFFKCWNPAVVRQCCGLFFFKSIHTQNGSKQACEVILIFFRINHHAADAG